MVKELVKFAYVCLDLEAVNVGKSAVVFRNVDGWEYNVFVRENYFSVCHERANDVAEALQLLSKNILIDKAQEALNSGNFEKLVTCAEFLKDGLF